MVVNRESIKTKSAASVILAAFKLIFIKINVHKIFKKTKKGIKMYIKRPKQISKRPLFVI